MDKLVDFSQPIEAYHHDGRVYAATLAEEYGLIVGARVVNVEGFFSPESFVDPSTGKIDAAPGWRIRNTAKPSTPSNEELTQRMDDAGERALGILHNWLTDPHFGPDKAFAAATELMSDLPKTVGPIDPDEATANAIALLNTPQNFPTDTRGLAEWVLKGIQAGRALTSGALA